MFQRSAFSILVSLSLLFATTASAAIIVQTTVNSNSSAQPDLFQLSDEGDFEGYFYSPFAVGDLAWGSGSLHVGHSGSGTIARTDARGGLINLIYTPLTSVHGLAVASDGRMYAAEGNSNRLYELTSTGQMLGVSFMSERITSLGIMDNGQLVFTRRNGTSSYSPYDVIIWDMTLGEQSTFATTLLSVFGITAVGDEILVAGSTSRSYYATTEIHRYTSAGEFISTVRGPENIRSITAHAPEPGTALLMGLGLAGLSFGDRRSAKARRSAYCPLSTTFEA